MVKDASFNGNLYLGGNLICPPASISSEAIYGLVSASDIVDKTTDQLVSGLKTFAYDVSLNANLWVEKDVSFNSNLFIRNDLSMNGNLYVSKDASLNANLFIQGNTEVFGNLLVVKDTSFNGNLYLGGNLICPPASISSAAIYGLVSSSDIVDKTTNQLVSGLKTFVYDVSLNANLWVNKDVSFNSNLFIRNDLSMNGNLYVRKDVSMNANLFVQGNSLLNGNLFVQGNSLLNGNLYVGRDVSFNSNLFIRNDLSMNGNLYVSKDVSFNGNLYVSKDVSMNANLYVRGNSIIQGNELVSGNLTVSQFTTFNKITETFTQMTASAGTAISINYITNGIHYVTATALTGNATCTITNVPTDPNRTYVTSLIMKYNTATRFCVTNVVINSGAAIPPLFNGGTGNVRLWASNINQQFAIINTNTAASPTWTIFTNVSNYA